MSAGIGLILEGLKQRGLNTDWSTREPAKPVNLPHITSPSGGYMAPRPPKTSVMGLIKSLEESKFYDELKKAKMQSIQDFEKDYMVPFDEPAADLDVVPRMNNDFLSKKGGAWTKSPKRSKSGDPTAKLKLPPAIEIKPQWEQGEIQSETELQQYFLGLLNRTLSEGGPDFTLMVKEPMTFMFRDRNWTFCGAEFYRLVAVEPARDGNGAFDRMGYYFEADDSGVEPKKLYGLNVAGFRKLFGGYAADDVIDLLAKSIRLNEKYMAAKSGFERKSQAATYAEEGIEFGSW